MYEFQLNKFRPAPPSEHVARAAVPRRGAGGPQSMMRQHARGTQRDQDERGPGIWFLGNSRKPSFTRYPVDYYDPLKGQSVHIT